MSKTGYILGALALLIVLGVLVWMFFFKDEAKARRMYSFMQGWSDEKVRFARDHFQEGYAKMISGGMGESDWKEGKQMAALMVASDRGDSDIEKSTVKNADSVHDVPVKEALEDLAAEIKASSRDEIIDEYEDKGNYRSYLKQLAKENAKYAWNAGYADKSWFNDAVWRGNWNMYRNKKNLDADGYPKD